MSTFLMAVGYLCCVVAFSVIVPRLFRFTDEADE